MQVMGMSLAEGMRQVWDNQTAPEATDEQLDSISVEPSITAIHPAIP
jgi:hypothetical protein